MQLEQNMYLKITARNEQYCKYYNIILTTKMYMYGIDYTGKHMRVENFFILNTEPQSVELVCVEWMKTLPLDYRKQMGYND